MFIMRKGQNVAKKQTLSWQIFFCKIGLHRQSYACTANVYRGLWGVCRFSLQSMEKGYKNYRVTLLLKGKDCIQRVLALCEFHSCDFSKLSMNILYNLMYSLLLRFWLMRIFPSPKSCIRQEPFVCCGQTCNS